LQKGAGVTFVVSMANTEKLNYSVMITKDVTALDISVKLTPHFGDIDPLNCCFEKERL